MSTIKLKTSSTAGKIPQTSDLILGELAVNTYDGRVYMKKNAGSDVMIQIARDVTTINLDGGNASSTYQS